MKFKENINKIHFDLSEKYDVKLKEKSNLNYGNYIELSINEDKKELNVKITKKEIENNEFNWKYMANPKDKNTVLVERKSTVDNFKNDVKDIFTKERFDN